MMTEDLEALKYFFQGEKKRREYEIYEAIDLYQKAYEKDSSFYLALYRLVYLENAFFGVDGDYNNIEILKNNLASLPPKYQKLAEALFDHLGHNALGSISKYGYLINSYPEDLEVNLMMGEALFHHNNLIGKSQLESLPYFEKVYQYDSLNKEASSHLFFLYLLQEDLEALKKFKDKEFIYHKGMSAILDKDSSRYTQTIIQVSSSDVSGAGIIANNTLNDRLIDVLTFLQDVRQIKPLPLDQFPLFQDHVSRGHEKWVIENGNKLAGPFSAVFPATIAAHPDIPAYRNYLPRLSTQINGIEEMLDAFPFASSSNYAELKCMLAIAQNQKDTFNFYMQKVLDKGKRNDDYKGYSNFTRHYFDGIIAYRDGLFEEALAHFTALDNITLSLEDDQSEFFTRPLPRFLRGEILMKKGKYDEALGFFENFWLGPLSIVMVPWTYLRRAEIYAIQNRTKEAIEYYGKFITLYKTSDAHYQSIVENARKERDRLIAVMN
jgi:tetratricopeptide (TPR) repeat protein